MSTLTLVRLTAAEAGVPVTRTRPRAIGAASAARRAAPGRLTDRSALMLTSPFLVVDVAVTGRRFAAKAVALTRAQPRAPWSRTDARMRASLPTLVTLWVAAAGRRPASAGVSAGAAEKLKGAERHEPGRQQGPDAGRVARRHGGDHELPGR